MIYYTLPEGAKAPSSLQVLRNHQNAAEKIGGKKLYENPDAGARRLTMMIPGGGGKETWVQVESGGSQATGYVLTIIEKGDLQQDVTATDMLDALNKSGHVALYINFDTGKATMKPDSAPIVDQIAAMMKSAPALKIAVEGHTDNVGDAKKNKKLSEDRANAVAQAIAGKGIDKARMTSAGFGSEKPVDDNKTDAGRAKNRRVELVKK
jgi:outer membrane protein OmpA-like peptidoglycan-associated protein